MRLGSSSPSKVMLGTSEVDKVYVGSGVTYTRFQPDPYWADVRLLLRMDGESVTDSSLYSRSVTTAGNAATSTAQKKFGARSLALDGTGDYVNTNAPCAQLLSSTGDFAFDAWIYPTQIATPATILSNREQTEGVDSMTLYIDAGGILTWRRVNGNASLTAAGATPAAANAWTHVALSRAAGTFRVYLNGALAATVLASSQSYSLSGTQPLFIGSDASAPAAGAGPPPPVRIGDFAGYIDEVRFTSGSARGYTGSTIPVPTTAFPGYGSTTDPLWSKVQMLLHLNNSAVNSGYVYSNSATLVSPSANDAQYLSGAARFGTHGVRLSGAPTGAVETNDQAYGRLILNDGLGAITPSWTFEAWIKPSATWSSGTKAIAGGGDRYYTLWDVKAVNQTLVFSVTSSNMGTSTLSATVTASVSGGLSAAWHHIAVTRDFATIKLYIDGSLAGTATLTGDGDVSATLAAGSTLAVGAAYDAANSNWLDGSAMDVDEVRVTHAARQITALPTTEFPEG